MISYHSEIEFNLDDADPLTDWLSDCISVEKYNIGDISFIFCSDSFLLEYNVKYLNHNTLTDIITFDYSLDKLVSGDIFISVERVQENANKFEVRFNDELHRVMIHGILHLCDYNDKTIQEKQQMRQKEDYYLSLRAFN